MYRVGLFVLSVFIFLSCSKEETPQSAQTLNHLPNLPNHFPAIEYPDGNEPTAARWKLGKALFFEKALSKDSSTSCASCHLPDKAFADDSPTSPGAFGRAGTSNAPSLWNVAYHPYLLRGGTVPSLEMQVLVPIQEENEFAHNIVALADELATNADYQRMSQQAYGRDMDPFVITRAIAQFERTLIASESDYDRYVEGDQSALSASAQRGMELFKSERLKCGQCHSGFNFTNYQMERNGTDTTTTQEGRYRSTGIPADYGRFKVPSLRDVANSAPYFHDGRFSTLEEVIEHYNKGGDASAPSHPLLNPLNLSASEKQDLLEFLYALSEPTPKS